MTIHLPQDVERSIEAAVQGGLFASADDALATAWRHLEQQRITSREESVTARQVAEPPVQSGRKPI